MSKLEQLEGLLKQKRSKIYYSERLNISTNEVEELLAELRLQEKKDDFEEEIGKDIEAHEDIVEHLWKVNEERGEIKSELICSFEPKTHEQLADLHKINLEKYKISSYWSKQRGEKFTSSVLATLIKIDSDLESQKDLLLQELINVSPSVNLLCPLKEKGTFAYEINIPDVHFGKMAWGEESGEDYDLKIAEEAYTEAIKSLLSLVNLKEVEKFIFPIGNDMINIDSRKNETFAGTRQDSDSRFFKIVRTVKEILIKNINALSTLAPVDVIVVSGNHDPESMFMIGEILDAYYHNNNNVNIDNSPKQRKYYQYGQNSFQYTHGNEEKHAELGLIFATEEPQLWADTEYRFAKLGHFHSNKKTSYVSVQEHQGFQVQILPSLSGSDAWHYSKGYMSKKQAKGFLYHKTKGQVAEYTYSV